MHDLCSTKQPYDEWTYGWKPVDYPNAMRINHRTMSLLVIPAAVLGNVAVRAPDRKLFRDERFAWMCLVSAKKSDVS